jgi:hypothetical protein
MRYSLPEARTVLGSLPRVGHEVATSVRMVLRWAHHHTGLPTVLVAALLLVLWWRLVRRTLRLAVEVLVALAFLVAATRMGWLTW